MNLKSPFFLIYLSITLYSIGMLVYGTVKVFAGAGSEAISAFGSVLGGIGAIFGGVAALIIFNGWKITENHKTKNEHINNAVNTYFQLQDLLKLKTIQATNIIFAIHTQALTFTDKIQLIVNLNEIQLEILYILRAFKTHIQLFSTVSDDLSLCGYLEQVIDEVETLSQNKLEKLLIAINSGTQQQIQISYDEYHKYITGPLVVDLHLKVVIKLTKESKAL